MCFIIIIIIIIIVVVIIIIIIIIIIHNASGAFLCGVSSKILGLFSNRTGTSVDDGARNSNNWLDQWQNGKLSTGSRV